MELTCLEIHRRARPELRKPDLILLARRQDDNLREAFLKIQLAGVCNRFQAE
jgi:hypothetical protein